MQSQFKRILETQNYSHKMKIFNQIQELQNQGVISPETALDISDYYKSKHKESSSRLTVIYSVIGSILIGLGLILLFAHNWDEMPKIAKTIVAIAPLAITQILGGYFMYKKPDNLAAREGIGSLLFICIGLSISMVSQIYNIVGSLDSFMQIWLLLTIPLLLILRSSMVAFLATIISTSYVILDGDVLSLVIYMVTIGLILIHFRILNKKEPNSNYINLASWIIPSALSIGLCAFEQRNDELLFLSYFWLFTLFIWVGNSKSWKDKSNFRNGFKLIGFLGILVMLTMISFHEVADKFITYKMDFGQEWVSLFLISIPLLLIIILKKGLFAVLKKDQLSMAFIPITFVFFFSQSEIISAIIVNALILIIGIQKVLLGLKNNRLGQLNIGLLIISILVSCRFFDYQMDLLLRGIVFLALGLGFLLSNLKIIKTRKNENQ